MSSRTPLARRVTIAGLLRGRFTGLMIVVLLLLFSMNTIAEKGLREAVTGLGFFIFLLFAIWSAGRRLRQVTVALAIPTMVGHFALGFSDSLALHLVAFGLVSVFLAFLTLVILRAVFRDEIVTTDTIVGAVCVYFLLGVTWGTIYAMLVLASPEAFSISPALASAASWGTPAIPLNALMQYYSFTTLATLGYGDVSPLTAGARGLSVLEGLIGQLYLAVLIARLVGMHSAGGTKQ